MLIRCLRKVTRNHRIFANDEAALKVVYLAIENISKKWTMPIREWKPALNRFAIEFEDRFPKEIILCHKRIDRSPIDRKFCFSRTLVSPLVGAQLGVDV